MMECYKAGPCWSGNDGTPTKARFGMTVQHLYYQVEGKLMYGPILEFTTLFVLVAILLTAMEQNISRYI
jgi:hypothetical protein